MSRIEKQENAAIERMTSAKQSAAYRAARRANIPVTVLRGDTIYRVTNEETVAVGTVVPPVKVTQRVISLK